MTRLNFWLDDACIVKYVLAVEMWKLEICSFFARYICTIECAAAKSLSTVFYMLGFF